MSAESFNDALEAFFRVVRALRWKADALPGGLSLAQAVLLRPLMDGGACGVGELADAAGIASPTATRTLDGLVRDGYITRRPSQSDRRSVLVELTDRGHAAMTQARDAMRARRGVLYERLSPEEREEAEELFRRLAEIMREP